MGEVRSEVGFWRAVGRLRLSDVFSVETAASFVLGIGLAVGLFALGTPRDRIEVASLYVGVAAALVAIVFAGVALVTSLLSDSYLRLLQASDSGVLGFLRPFMIAVGVQVATLLGAVGFAATAEFLPPGLEPWFFGVLSVLFVASCLEVVVLMRSVFMHALLRTKFAQTLENERRRQAGQ
ncbi:hypothetical protein RZO50_11185 [Microbacterium sp. SSW1-59]|uniref:hypothetical protein n=1 Tax=Microbacterium xanthum TaxID=3079794 RepID=UPI002AD205CB|nr:hypothetical protein [Microbacterium sp. SSW1-59]MDZ8202080.1 hypothetical protein [Microbacterium sp. SSW1-59]